MTAVLGSNAGGGAEDYFQSILVPAAGYANDIAFFEDLTVTIGANVALYSDNGLGTAPQNLLAQGPAQAVNYGWTTFSVGPLLLAPGIYWLAVQTNTLGGIATTAQAGSGFKVAKLYSADFSSENPVSGGSTANASYSIYMDLCALAATPTPTFSVSPTSSPSATPTVTGTFSASPSPTLTISATATWTPTASATLSPSVTVTPTFTPPTICLTCFCAPATKRVGAGQTYTTINAALAVAVPGDVVEIEDSATYVEWVNYPNMDNTVGLTLRGAAGQRPVIQAPAGSNPNGLTDVVTVEYNGTLCNVTVDGNNNSASGVESAFGKAGYVINHVLVENTTNSGIWIKQPGGSGGLAAYRSIYVTDCIVQRVRDSQSSPGWGMALQLEQGTAQPGLAIYFWNDTTAQDYSAFYLNGSTVPYDIRNLVEWDNNTLSNWDKSRVSYSVVNDALAGYGAGVSNGNPLFVDSSLNDFHLQLGSPAIDSGDGATVGLFVPDDFEYRPRPVGAQWDRGAYEYGPAFTPTSSPTSSPSGTPTATPSATGTSTPTATPSISPTFSASPSPTLTNTDSFTDSPTATPSISPTFSASPSPTLTNTDTFTYSPTATLSISPTFSASPSPTLTNTDSFTYSPTATPSISPTFSASPSPTLTNTDSFTYSPTATPSISPTFSASPSPTLTNTDSFTYSPTATPSMSPTFSATQSATPSITGTFTYSPTASPSISATFSATLSATPSITGTFSYSPTASQSISPTLSATLSATPSVTGTFTYSPTPTVSPTFSASPSPTLTVTGSFTYSPTLTHSPTLSPSITPTSTRTPSASPSITPTWTWTLTATPFISSTVTPSATPSITRTLTPTPSFSATPLGSATSTPTNSPSPSMTSTKTPQPTATPQAPTLSGPIDQGSGGEIVTGTGAPGEVVTILDNGSPIGSGVVGVNGTFEISVSPVSAGDVITAAGGGAGGPSSGSITAVLGSGVAPLPLAPLDGGGSIAIVSGKPGDKVVAVEPGTGEVLGSVIIGPSGEAGLTLNPLPAVGANLQLVIGGNPGGTLTVSGAGSPPVVNNGVVLEEGSTVTGTGKPGDTVYVVDDQGTVLGSGVVDPSGAFAVVVSGAAAGHDVYVVDNGVKAQIKIRSGKLGSETAFTSTNVFKPLQGGSMSIGIKALNDDHITVKIFSLSGELVRPVLELDVKAGQIYSCSWDGRNADGDLIASGIYFVSVHGAHQRAVKKVIVLK